MFSRISGSFYRTAAWRLALRSTIVFAVGSATVFLVMYGLVARTVRDRTDSWLIGESETLKQVALNTPKDSLYRRIVGEVAELATQEVAYDEMGHHTAANTVFFLQTDNSGRKPLWVGPAQPQKVIDAIGKLAVHERSPLSIRVPGWRDPFRVTVADLGPGGGRIFLGLQDSNAKVMLARLLMWFFLGWLCMVAFGFLITVLGLRRTLKRVDAVTSAASSIGASDLSGRVPAEGTPNDEITRLSQTFNNMLDRISVSVCHLRTLTDSVAHDMKSPITSVRGDLEAALSTDDHELARELVAKAVENLDRLSDIITSSLDVAEAEAGALRMHREPADVADLVHRVAELYAPAFLERRQTLTEKIVGPAEALVDQRFLIRILSNLMENELRYAGEGAQVQIALVKSESHLTINVQDDGPGFPADLLDQVFQRFAKGVQSQGHGLGLAFVKAIACAHGGHASVRNLGASGGAEIIVEIPRVTGSEPERLTAVSSSHKVLS
jgi:signal transduction histidine kinase